MQLLLVRIFTVILQIIAGILALRLIGITKRRTVWIFISAAILLAAIERSLTYYRLLYGIDDLPEISIATEYLSFYIAIFMLFGIGGLHALFGELNRSHQMVVKSERKYRTLLENLPQCIYLKDSAQIYASCNENFAHDAGLSPENIEGKTDFDLFEPQAARKNRDDDQRVIDSGEIEETDIEIERDGELVYLHAIKTPLKDYDNGRSGLLVIYWDVTDQKKADDERRAIQEKMQQAQKLEGLGVLAGGIAHDFNNLLTAILGNAYLVLQDLPNESEIRNGITEIEAAANRAAELTAQMLAYSGQGQYSLRRVDLCEELEQFEDFIKASISKRVLLEIEKGAQNPVVEIDPYHLQQVVINLTTNASEAIGDANGVIRISTGVASYTRRQLRNSVVNIDELAAGEYGFLEVSDTGCGFDESESGKIFEPFYSTKFTGRGLGLAAVLGIVRSRRGGIFVSSRPGQGSSFRIVLPSLEDMGQQQELPAVDETALTDLHGSGTVLVVDDERVVREVARRLLEIAGFTVLTASNGPEAIEMYKLERDVVNCILLDMTMPLMSGQETFAELRKIDEHVRIIISSGYNELEVTQRFVDEHFVDFVQKPYNYAKLYRAIKTAVEKV